ncbi:MAG: hypothetical protein CL862_14145 [Cyanobium sp. NAT70]|nr:hypothetical protein [Cyanobium sp. NAT70]
MPSATSTPTDAAQPRLPELLQGNLREQESNSITFNFSDLVRSKRCLLKAAWTLNRQGIIRLRQVASADLIEAVNAQISQLLDDATHYKTSGIDDIAYLNLPNRRVLKGYNTFVDADRAVINHRVERPDGRSGSDAGMIDIFHPERLSDEMKRLINECLQERLIRRVIMISCLTPMRVKCRNIYLNRGVKDTRSYHCDGRSLKFKSFLFLSNIDSLDIGPYCYVKTSHRNRRSWKLSRAFNEEHGIGMYEYSQLGDCQALPMFAAAGDMVISSQRGAHRGHPQHTDAQRAVLVNMYQR